VCMWLLWRANRTNSAMIFNEIVGNGNTDVGAVSLAPAMISLFERLFDKTYFAVWLLGVNHYFISTGKVIVEECSTH